MQVCAKNVLADTRSLRKVFAFQTLAVIKFRAADCAREDSLFRRTSAWFGLNFPTASNVHRLIWHNVLSAKLVFMSVTKLAFHVLNNAKFASGQIYVQCAQMATFWFPLKAKWAAGVLNAKTIVKLASNGHFCAQVAKVDMSWQLIGSVWETIRFK